MLEIPTSVPVDYKVQLEGRCWEAWSEVWIKFETCLLQEPTNLRNLDLWLLIAGY